MGAKTREGLEGSCLKKMAAVFRIYREVTARLGRQLLK